MTKMPMTNAYAQAAGVRPQDLDGRSLQITCDGARWVEAPNARDCEPARLLDLYRKMVLTRAVDLEAVKFHKKGKAYGKIVTCRGNEATAVGAASATRQSDWVTLAIRDLGALLVRGVPAHQILSQALGRVDGPTKGWDGWAHVTSRPTQTVGLVSHLGTLLPVAAGLAFAARYRGTDDAALAFTGDGATSGGDFYEALNIASVHRLPLVIVIENNQWAFGTPNSLQFAVPTLALRSLAFGTNVHGEWIDGTNVFTVFDAVERALEKARRQQIVTIIEAVTMRMEGHSVADPFETYVPDEDLAFWRERDPIARCRRCITEARIATADDLDAIDAAVAEEVLAAALQAEASPEASDSDLASRVFSAPSVPYSEPTQGDSPEHLITYGQAITDALQEEMDRNPEAFMIGEDIGLSNGAFKITEGFAKRYDGEVPAIDISARRPIRQRRVIDAPLGESGYVGLAMGAQLAGLRPIIEFQYADFSSDAFKMLVNYAATETVRGMGPVNAVFRLPAGWAARTSIYHSVNPESWYGSTPGLKIVAPATAFDAKGLLKAAIHDNNPVLFLEYKDFYRRSPDKIAPELALPVPEEPYYVPIGRGRIVTSGTALTVVAYGSQVWRALEAVRQVEREDGVSIELIDLRSIVPFDRDLIRSSVARTNRSLVTCEAPKTGCFGATIAAYIAETCFDDLDAPVRLVAAADTPVPFAPGLEREHLPTVDKLVIAIRELLAH